MLAIFAQDVVFGQADHEAQPIFVRDAKGDQPVDAVEGADTPIVTGGAVFGAVDRLAACDLAADDIIRKSLRGENDVVLIAYRDGALRAEIDGPVKRGDETGVDREQDHPGRTAVGITKPPQQLDRQPARSSALDRLADDQLIVGGIQLLAGVRTVADIKMRTVVIQRGCDLETVGVDQGELECFLADQRGLSRPFAQVEISGIVLETLAQQQQRAVETVDGFDGVVLEQPHQTVGLLHRFLDRLLALDGGDVGGDEPARGNQDQTGNSGRMQESPHPEQPFAAHDHLPKPPRRKRATRACFIAPRAFNPSLRGHVSAWRS
jgi:hypothetical protein